MEQINLTATKDADKVYKMLGDLMHMNREFQIMITVPSVDRQTQEEGKKEVQRVISHNLERDVTDMIHESVSIFERSHYDVGRGCRDAGFYHQSTISYHCKKISDHGQQSGACHTTCHRSGVEQRKNGNLGCHVWLYH